MRGLLRALLLALPAVAGFQPSASFAIPTTYTYTITGGSFYQAGAVLGGSFTVTYPNSPCSGGPSTCPIYLEGTVLTPMGSRPIPSSRFFALTGLQQASDTGANKGASWLRLVRSTPISTLPSWRNTKAYRGSFFNQFSVATPNEPVSVYLNMMFTFFTFGGTLGHYSNSLFGQEVGHAIPEPAPAELIALGLLFLGALRAHHAARRPGV